MKEVTFGMVWQMAGKQTISIPDDIDPNDQDAIRDYIKENWDSIPIPADGEGDYISGSDELDETVEFVVMDDGSQPRVYINALEGLPAAIDRNVKVEWTDCGEGLCGEYDAEDPDDIHLLRFDVYVVRDGSWVAVDDASYCTQMPADTGLEILKRAVKRLAKEYADVLADDPDTSVKKLGEGLSWIAPDWFQNK